MATNDVDFKIKNGLKVGGNADLGGNLILGNAPISYDTVHNRLQVQINGAWVSFAFTTDIPDSSQDITFMDIGLAIDYNGEPTYIVQCNGVTPSSSSKFLDGGNPSTISAEWLFDSGVIV